MSSKHYYDSELRKDDELPTVAPQQPVAAEPVAAEQATADQSSALARDAFMNALRILYSMEPVWLPVRFVRDPVVYLMRADDETVDRIWDEIQRRQPERFRV